MYVSYLFVVLCCVFFVIRLTVLLFFLFEQICQSAGQLRATLNGLNR